MITNKICFWQDKQVYDRYGILHRYYRLMTIAAFSRKSNFVTVIKFFNMIDLVLKFLLNLNV